MTTWTTISNSAVAVGGIPSSTTVTALRDNPSAIAESSSGAPVIAAGWHPVDKVTVGDGKTGLIYDFAVNGTVASVVTPDFADGWEYRIIAADLNSTVTTTVRLNLDGYFQTDANYRRLRYTGDGGGLSRFGYDVEILAPRLAKEVHLAPGPVYINGQLNMDTIDNTSYTTGPAQKLLRARVIFTSGSINAGKVWLFRRREYASLA